MTPARPATEAARLAEQLERSYRGGAWHGPSLVEALDGVDSELATRRPPGGAHTILEIVSHVAFWLEIARRRIAGEPQGDLEDEADWPAPDAATGEAWREVRNTLEAAHRRLHETVLGLEDERLGDPVPGSDPTVRGLLLGVLQHNAYHAGQIVLLVKQGGGSRR